jgi:hypothetical protein
MFSRAVSVDNVATHEGRVEASPSECADIAATCKIERLSDFSLTYRLLPLSQGRFLLDGRLQANVTQACVITLEPVDERIDEAFSVELWPEDQIAAEENDEAVVDNHNTEDHGGDAFLAGPPDPPEPIVNGRYDLGAFAAEMLAAAINPYPRKEGAVFSWTDPTDAPEKSGPFAALAKMRGKRDDDSGTHE